MSEKNRVLELELRFKTCQNDPTLNQIMVVTPEQNEAMKNNKEGRSLLALIYVWGEIPDC